MESLRCIFTYIAIIFKYDLRLSKCQSWCSGTLSPRVVTILMHSLNDVESGMPVSILLHVFQSRINSESVLI